MKVSLFAVCFSVFLFISPVTKGQFKSVSLGVNGLTCSMCQKSVEKSLYRLKFIESINTDLENTTLQITFKPGSEVYIYQIAQKVRSAGFSVRDLDAVFQFNNVTASNNTDFTFSNATYHFVETNGEKINGDVKVRFVGNDYMTKEEYRKYSSSLSGVYTLFNSITPVYCITLPK